MPPIQFSRAPAAQLSLVNSSSVAGDGAPSDDRWFVGNRGFEFQPEACSGGWIENPCDVAQRSALPDRPSKLRVMPFEVVTGDRCSTFGWQEAEYQRRAQDLLERCESTLISRELWEGMLAQSEGWNDNLYLASPTSDTVTDAPAGVIDVLACLEQGLAECGCGVQGMIHATRQLVTHWAALGPSVLRLENGILRTVHGTIVVSDAGYTGTGPNGETDAVWAYATGMVHVLRGPVTVTPDTLTGVWSDVNDLEFYASRPAAYAWDGCCHLAAEADLAPCLIGGAS